MNNYKRISLMMLLLITVLVLTGCIPQAETFDFNITSIHTIRVITVDEDDLENQTILNEYDQLSDDDQIIIDIYALFDTHQYKIWEDYRIEKNRATFNYLEQSTVIELITDTETYTFGLATMSYPHLDHEDQEQKTVLLDATLFPVQVIDLTLYTGLLDILNIS